MPAKRNNDRDGEMGRGTAFDIDGPVDLGTLDMELAAELDVPGPIGIIAEGDVTQASPKNLVTVWTLTDVDTNVFKRVFTAHDAAKRLGEESAFVALVAKARDTDDDFTPEEINLALRTLLRGAR